MISATTTRIVAARRLSFRAIMTTTSSIRIGLTQQPMPLSAISAASAAASSSFDNNRMVGVFPTFFLPRHHFFSSTDAPPVFLDSAEVMSRIIEVVKNFEQVDQAKVNPQTKFAEDLGLDSLDIVEVVMAIEDEFAIEIPDQEADKIASIADAVEYISTHPMAK